MNIEQLPTHEACNDSIQAKTATALEIFIYNNEPAEIEESEQFRTELLNLINEAQAQPQTEDNSDDFILKLSDNLILESVQENNYENGKLIAVILYFQFYGETFTAYVTDTKFESEYACYGMVEGLSDGSSELFESFTGLIEDSDNWEKIKDEIAKYKTTWEKLNQD